MEIVAGEYPVLESAHGAEFSTETCFSMELESATSGWHLICRMTPHHLIPTTPISSFLMMELLTASQGFYRGFDDSSVALRKEVVSFPGGMTITVIRECDNYRVIFDRRRRSRPCGDAVNQRWVSFTKRGQGDVGHTSAGGHRERKRSCRGLTGAGNQTS